MQGKKQRTNKVIFFVLKGILKINYSVFLFYFSLHPLITTDKTKYLKAKIKKSLLIFFSIEYFTVTLQRKQAEHCLVNSLSHQFLSFQIFIFIDLFQIDFNTIYCIVTPSTLQRLFN